MARKYKSILIIINLIFIFTIISIPTFILLAEFSNFNRIDDCLSYIYSSTTPPLKKELNLKTDIGIIDVKYITQPVNYIVKIEVNIEMAGPNLNGKSYLDFFYINWENNTSPLNFTLDLISNRLEDFSKLHKANINIDILLRADIIFDINASVNEGSINLAVPVGITVNNMFLRAITGDLFYDFTHCIVEGNITGLVNYGNLTFKAYNIIYTQNSKLNFINELGHILIDIYQYEEIGANITGTGITETGIIKIIYNDYSTDVGARFILYNKTNFGNEAENNWVGFNREILPLLKGQMYTSYDFPAQNNYNFSLHKPEDNGDFIWNLNSIPT